MWGVVFALLGGLAAQEKVVEAPKSALTFERAIAMPGVEGRIDHMAYDWYPGWLFVAALENGSIEILELRKNAAIEPFLAPEKPTGAVYVADGDRVFVADGKLGCLWAGEMPWGFQESWRTQVGDDADNLRYLPIRKSLVVAYGEGGLCFVDLKDVKRPALGDKIELGGHPESFQLDSAEKRCWANVPDKQAVAVVDIEAKKVVRWIELKTAKKNYPMALAEKDKRVLVGCREPARLLVFDMETDAVAGDLPLSGDVDDIFVDEERGLVYASCGEGFVDVFERKAPGAWLPKEKVKTSPGARTCLFVPSERKLFVAVPQRGEQQAEVRVFSTAP